MPQVEGYAAGMPAWVDLATTDPEGAKAFYGELFGWEFAVGPDDIGNYTMCRVHGQNAAGLNGKPVRGMPTAWHTYIAGDAEACARLVKVAGGSVLAGPLDVATAARILFAEDPTAAPFGVWDGRDHLGAAVVAEPGAVTWNVLATGDVEAAQEFYAGVFGWSWQPGSGGTSAFFVDGRPAGSTMSLSADGADDPAWIPHFGTPDTDAAVARATALGASTVTAPNDAGYGRTAVLRDPQDGLFGVVELGEQPAG